MKKYLSLTILLGIFGLAQMGCASYGKSEEREGLRHRKNKFSGQSSIGKTLVEYPFLSKEAKDNPTLPEEESTSNTKPTPPLVLEKYFKEKGIKYDLTKIENKLKPFTQDTNNRKKFMILAQDYLIPLYLRAELYDYYKSVADAEKKNAKEGEDSMEKKAAQTDAEKHNVKLLEPATELPSEISLFPEKLPPLKILVAEDNVFNQIMIKALLTKAGDHFTLVKNGREAVEAVQKEKYDLVLMDEHMPTMDGFEATRQIRQVFNAEELPIIGLTTGPMKRDCDTLLLQSGMTSYLTKPIQQGIFYTEILRYRKK